MQGQRGNYKDKVCLVSAENSFIEADKLHAGKSKGKAALMLLKSFLIINHHLFRQGFCNTTMDEYLNAYKVQG